MQNRLILALLMILSLAGGAVAQNKPAVRVPNLSVFNDGNEMIGALSALGLNGRITEMAAPSPEFEGKFGQLPLAGSFLPPGGDVFIFKYGKHVPETPAAKPATEQAATTGQPDPSMDAMVAGPDQAFVGEYAGTMKSPGGDQQITVSIKNDGTWSLIVGVPGGIIGTSPMAGDDSTAMESGVLVYHLKGGNHESTLSVKVSGNDLVGTLVSVSGTGAYAHTITSTLSARRTP